MLTTINLCFFHGCLSLEANVELKHLVDLLQEHWLYLLAVAVTEHELTALPPLSHLLFVSHAHVALPSEL